MINRILLVDDDRSMLDLVSSHLQNAGFAVTVCESGEEALEALKTNDFSLVITDLKMAGLNGIELCDRINGNHPDLPVLILTGFGTLDTAVESIRAGAYDFIMKPVHLEALTETVSRAVRNYRAKRQMRRLEDSTASSNEIGEEEVIGESRAIVDLRALLKQISDIDTSVLITGESGTGKELVAQVLHRNSARRNSPFVVVDCATIPEHGFEKEVFGEKDSEAGASTGGLVSRAGTGTLFFDEIGHLPLSVQPKLLRLLEERTYRPVGGSEEVSCAARFVVATNEDLDSEIEEGRFREDLFFRINVMHVKLAPLRERGNDVLILARYFMKSFAKRFSKQVRTLSDPVVEKLMSYEWPGNVRELRNAIERAVVVASYDQIVVEDLPDQIRRFKVADIFASDTKDRPLTVEAVEQQHILTVLKDVGGNKALASKLLKLDRKTLYRKLERYGYKD